MNIDEWLEIGIRVGAVALVSVLVLLAVMILRKFLGVLHQIKSDRVFLEVTPPAFKDKTVSATESLINAMHSLGTSRTLLERLLGGHSVFSTEIVATRKEGIRFVMSVNAAKASSLEQAVLAYLPHARVTRIDDVQYDLSQGRIFEFTQGRHFAYPLKTFDELKDNDPAAYITGAMTKLADNEIMIFQLTLKATNSREADALRHKILTNQNLVYSLGGGNNFGVIKLLGKVINVVCLGMIDFVSSIADHGSSSYKSRSGYSREWEHKMQVARMDKPARTMSTFEEELVRSMQEKLARPLFEANIQAFIGTQDKTQIKERKSSLSSSLGLFSVPKYQSLRLMRRKFGFERRMLEFAFKKRLVGFGTKTSLLASSEVAGLYHFPHSESAHTENMVKSHSKTLPASLALKDGTQLDVLFGENHHQGTTTPIGLTADERERHMYIIGGTGNGKTTMLKYQIVQDIRSGKGVGVIDPHGDLAEELLGYIPKERIKDVIYLNPKDTRRPIGLNLLELQPGLEDFDLEDQKDLIAESIVSVLKKVFSDDDTIGSRIAYVLRNAIHTAFYMDEPTLFSITDLIRDKKLRKAVLDKVDDQDLKQFWSSEINKAGHMQVVKNTIGTTSKIGRFFRSVSARGMMQQKKSTINFDDIINGKKILICNFPKGKLGEDTSSLFGTTILTKLQLAAMKRTDIKEKDRVPFYLYVDEFQNFATNNFMQMLSEARKYRMFLIMAEQSTQQLEDPRMIDIILNNAGTIVSFRTGSPKDEELIRPRLGKKEVDEGELSNLPVFNFYAKIAAINPHEAVSGKTVLLETEPDENIAKQVIEFSRMTYGVERNLEEEKRQSFAQANTRKNDSSKKAKSASTSKKSESTSSNKDGQAQRRRPTGGNTNALKQ